MLLLSAHFAEKTTLINPLEQVFNVNITHLIRILAQILSISSDHSNCFELPPCRNCENRLLLIKHCYCKTASISTLRDQIMSDDRLVIYHNPQCSKSRETLQILEDHECNPDIVEYLQQPPDSDELKRIIALLGISARDLLRTTETAYLEAGLDHASISENGIIEALCKYPVLLQRPIVVWGNKAVIGRPPSNVLLLLQHDNCEFS